MNGLLRSACAADRLRPLVSGLLALALLLSASAEGARLPKCTSVCTPTCTDACSNLEDCRDVQKSIYDLRLLKCAPPGKFPSFAPGRCTIIRECVEKQRDFYAASLAQCRRGLRDDVRAECKAAGAECRISTETAFRTCGHCKEVTPPPAVAVVPLQASDCQTQCLRKYLGGCSGECLDECRGDSDAFNLCSGGCEDGQCTKLKNKCTLPPVPLGEDGEPLDLTDPDNKAALDAFKTELEKRNPVYLGCCGVNLDEPDVTDSACAEDAQALDCEATTSTTTTTSTTAATTSSSTTTRVTTAGAGL
jgi:hypothetical protein